MEPRWSRHGYQQTYSPQQHASSRVRPRAIFYALPPSAWPLGPSLGVTHRNRARNTVVQRSHTCATRSLNSKSCEPLYGPEYTLKRPDTHPTDNREMNPRSPESLNRILDMVAICYLPTRRRCRQKTAAVDLTLAIASASPVHSFSPREPLSSL